MALKSRPLVLNTYFRLSALPEAGVRQAAALPRLLALCQPESGQEHPGWNCQSQEQDKGAG